ncbi:MAG TPA: hypothetical protein DCO82_09205 [Alphaproteobacteria bacterium]|nr:hypothetical protein [Alphaproteobacteria bacterium]
MTEKSPRYKTQNSTGNSCKLAARLILTYSNGFPNTDPDVRTGSPGIIANKAVRLRFFFYEFQGIGFMNFGKLAP